MTMEKEKTKKTKYTVIKDTREKTGWFFGEGDQCAGMISATLHTGDYSIEGYEKVISIERKASPEEIATNVGFKCYSFEREMQRLSKFDHAYLICEFSLSDLLAYPNRTTVPMSKRENLKITGKYILKCLMEYQMKYNVKILFCDNQYNAFVVANSILKRFHEQINAK